jgi:beta-phosphoglucomutase
MTRLPGLDISATAEGLVALAATSDGRFHTGGDGVRAISATGDRKVEFVAFAEHTLAHVRSALGSPAYYPVLPVRADGPFTALLMDLDGTSVHSEEFWIWMIARTTATLLGHERFELEAADLPYVSGHSVSEHLAHCLAKYCPGRTLEEARAVYFRHVHHEMREVLEGRGRVDAFRPAPGLKDFLLGAKARGLRIALVTSGLYEKAYPEIVAVFRQIGLGEPTDFYDAIITAGFPLRKGEVGTLGELSPKPHPWLYAEACRVGLGMGPEERERVVGLEDSAAGVCAVRLAGFTTIGMAGGTILEGGTRALCHAFAGTLEEALHLILEGSSERA